MSRHFFAGLKAANQDGRGRLGPYRARRLHLFLFTDRESLAASDALPLE